MLDAVGGRSGGRADALHGDAGAARLWATKRPRARRRCSCASRPTSRRRRSPAIGGCSSPRTTTSGSSIHEHESVPLAAAARHSHARMPQPGEPSVDRDAAIRWRRAVRAALGAARRGAQPGRVPFTDVTARRRHPLRAQQRPRRQEVAARNAGLGRRVLRRRRRRLARPALRQRPRLEAARGRTIAERALPQQPATAPSRTSRPAAGSTSSCTAWASPSATTTTTAATTSTSPRSKATGCSTTRAAASSAT